MEFLKSCTTNAQAIGDLEAVVYQAFSVTRDTTTPPARPRDWSPSEDIRAVQAHLRQDRHLVAHDASRPWLWLFTPTTVDKAGQGAGDVPLLEGFLLQREQAGFLKASELARPPMRATNPHALAARSTPVSQGSATDQQPPDCLTLYELFASSVTALISFFVVKNCQAIVLNYRTFVSKAALQPDHDAAEYSNPAHTSWLTSLNVHWISSGTLIITTTTMKDHSLRCLGDIETDEQPELLGQCVRIAPNASLASISSFDDPLSVAGDEMVQVSRRKRAKISSLEQSIDRWKATVVRWLKWKGLSLAGLEKPTSWVRIRPARPTLISVSSPGSSNPDRDILWPRSLCFYRQTCRGDGPSPLLQSGPGNLKWFQGPGSDGFKDPIDVAQEWFSGKADRDRTIEMQRKAKKAAEEAARLKEEPVGLYPSSPLHARTGAYGDLQAVSGVYPTPPDGIVPGTVVSTHDTPSVSGTATNVILASGGTNPAINISAPHDQIRLDGQEPPSTSPLFPENGESYNASGFGDDLFEDMEGEGAGGIGIDEADFDFFDGPNDEDIDMTDAPLLPQAAAGDSLKPATEVDSVLPSQSSVKEVSSDPLVALENALEPAPIESKTATAEKESTTGPHIPASEQVTHSSEYQQKASQVESRKSITKEPTPPLSPRAVADALEPSPTNKSILSTKEQNSSSICQNGTFHPLDFSRRLSLADAKYQAGRFADHRDTDAETDIGHRSATSTKPKSLRDIPLLTKLRYTVGVATESNTLEAPSLARAASVESDSSSSETSGDSEEDEEEERKEEAPAGPLSFLGRLVIPAKRKLVNEGNGTPLSVTSFTESLGGDWLELHGLQLDEASIATFESSPWDWSMIDFTTPVEKSSAGARYSMPSLPPPNAELPDTPTSQPDLSMDILDEKPVTAKDSIVITQIVTEQIVSTTLDLLGEDDTPDMGRLSATENRWQIVVKNVFPNAIECSIPALAAVHDLFPDLSSQAKGQQRPPPRKPNESTAVPGNYMYQINPPFIRVRRAENNWDLLPPSIAFWEPLGLSPASPAKNVVPFCVYPHSDSLKPLLTRFLLNVQIAYDTCKLGAHTRVETVIDYEGGLVPWKLESPAATPKAAFKALRETCQQLGKFLGVQNAQIREQQDAKIDAFIIYMIDPFGDASAIWELCSAFWAMFHAYGQVSPGRSDQAQKPDLVLQIVPIRYIASFDAPVVLDASTYLGLAREVYDRCPPSAPSIDKTPLNIYKAPSFHLEEGLPRGIPFKLVSEPPQDLLRENSYMHLAYSVSLDGTWITAAWTDNCGKSQAVVSYHLGTRMFGEIAKEIWQTTIEIVQSRRVQWRVCIAKSGTMDREELETWVLLITCPTQVSLFVTLLTVNTDSPYKLSPSPNPTANATRPSNTPGSTPQPGVSPDPSMGLTPAATPSADAPDPAADPEARLVDVTDESWGIILAHRLHNSTSTNHFCPALISGLLIKRGETPTTSTSTHHPIPDPLPGPITVAVNILWIGAVGSTRAAPSPFPPAATDGVSPGAYGNAAASSAPPSPSPAHERSSSSLMWTPTVQTRATAENLLKEVLGQYRGLGLLAKLRGLRGTMHGSVPWHVVAAKRGVEGLSKVTGGI